MRTATATAVGLLLAILAWSALVLQLWLTVSQVIANGGSLLLGVVRNYSYFTVLTNTLAALVLTASVTSARARPWLCRPGTRAATAAYMAMVGVIYTLVLRETWDPRGLQKFADVVLHDLMPVAFGLYWLLVWRTGTLRANNLPSWLIYPLGYLGYCLIHGAIGNWYPYPFIDVRQHGYGQVFVTAVVITLALSFLCAIVVGIDRLQVGRAGSLAR